MVELFDAIGVSFVAVTQQFNTTTSMGRLTLNVLLSFAQFEREVIGERIRDKVAASKRKGIWMGGVLPLGYDVRERKLSSTRRKRVPSEISSSATSGLGASAAQDLSFRAKVRVSRAGVKTGGREAFRAARSTICSRTRSTSARSATSRNAIRDSTRRSRAASYGNGCNSTCAIKRCSIGERPD